MYMPRFSPTGELGVRRLTPTGEKDGSRLHLLQQHGRPLTGQLAPPLHVHGSIVGRLNLVLRRMGQHQIDDRPVSPESLVHDG